MKKNLDAIAKEYADNRLNFESYYRSKIILEHIKDGNILNLGIGDGIIVSSLAGLDMQVDAVDASGEIIKKYLDNYGQRKNLKLIKKYFEEFSPKKKYNEIIMANILEHVEDDASLIEKVKGWLQEKGQVHIVVPNGNSLHRLLGIEMGLIKRAVEISEKDVLWGHKRVFVKETLEGLAIERGLKIIKSCGVFLKPLTTSYLSSLPKELLDGLYRLGFEFPDHCGYLYILCRR